MRRSNRRPSNYSSISSRKTATFTLGGENSDSEMETEREIRPMNSIEGVAIKALEQAVSNIVKKGPNQPLLGVPGDKYFDAPTPFNNELGMVNIHRPIYSQSKFNRIFGEKIARKSHRFFDTVFRPKVIERNYCEMVYSIFPLLFVLKNYNFKKHFPLDFLSGLTTGVMRVPQSMAYALLANLPPVFGLYTAFFSALIYPVFGGSNHMAAGAQGVVSLLIGGGVIRAMKNDMLTLCNPNSTNIAPVNGSLIPCKYDFLDHKINIAITITFMVGVIQCFLGIFRFGFVTNYLSDPLIGGYTSAAAVTVVVSQLPAIFGVVTFSHTGILNMWRTLSDFVSALPKTNYATLIISAVCMIVLILCKYLSFRFVHKLKIPIPGELIVMVGAIIFSSFAKPKEIWDVHVLGQINPGFLKPRLPDRNFMLNTIDASFPAAIVSFAIGYSISKRMALKHDYDINGNQEIFAFGFMNGFASFFNCFAATASMTSSALHDSLGGKSQIANLFASIIILMALLFIGPLFSSTPECVLSTIILINLKSILSQVFDLVPLWKVSKIDFLLWLVTFLAVIVLDVDIGLAIGVIFSLITIVFRTQWPYSCLLGRIPCTDIYKNINLVANTQEIEGIKIFRFEGSLYFASADHFRNSIQRQTGLYPAKIINERKELSKKLIKVKMILEHDIKSVSESTQKIIDTSIIDMNPKNIHHIIIDFSTCSFIDSVGVRTIMQVINDYNLAKVSIFLANVRAAVLKMVNNENSFNVNPRHIFISVHDAVLGALEDARNTRERNYIIKNAALKSGTRCVSRIASDPMISQSLKFH